MSALAITVGRNVAHLPMPDNAAGASTIGEYLVRLAQEVWREGEEFSGKRPFGDSGWEWEVYQALAQAGLIEYTASAYRDEDDPDFVDYESFDEDEGNRYVDSVFQYLLSVVTDNE